MAGFRGSWRVILVLGLAPWAAAALDTCPGATSQYSGADGGNFDLCPGTTFDGPSDEVVANITSAVACAAQCDSTPACLRAVYDAAGAECLLKSNAKDALAWVAATSGQYTAVYWNNTLPEDTVVAVCPYNETTSTAGDGAAAYRTCAHTDVRGRSARMVEQVASTEACRDLCVQSACATAVYDRAEAVCHIKGDAASNTLIWYTNKRYDTIQQEANRDPAVEGAWSDIVRFPVIPVAAYIVPEFPRPTRILMFSSWGTTEFGPAGGYTQFADYNFETGEVSHRVVAETNHDMFCPGMSSLQDGRLVISGGANAEAVSLYNPVDNTFTRAANMTIGRGYQTSTTLSDGRVFTIGGAFSGPYQAKSGEVYDPIANTWTALPGADVAPMMTTDDEGLWREDNHAWLFGWKNGSIFQAGPSMAQNWYTADGNGSVVHAGVRDTQDSMCGIHVMYEPGAILSAGGSQTYDKSPATAKAHVTRIDAPGTASAVEAVAPMAYPRGFANAVVLPDGTVVVTGGQNASIVFTDTDAVLFPERFAPATQTWTTLAPEAVPRNYHSVSLLLPDARVFSGGGGLCYVATLGAERTCDDAVDHLDGQIFSPPYLYAADGALATRPELVDVSATNVTVGDQLQVTVDQADAQLVLIRIGSATHSVNSDQRRIPLDNVAVQGDVYTATLPSDSGILIPGFYYLFAVSAGGVPSIARTLQITL